jgi:hypothetical protein
MGWRLLIGFQAKWLKAAFDEMDSSSETVHLLISPAAPFLRLSTAGSSGSSEVCCVGDRTACVRTAVLG